MLIIVAVAAGQERERREKYPCYSNSHESLTGFGSWVGSDVILIGACWALYSVSLIGACWALYSVSLMGACWALYSVSLIGACWALYSVSLIGVCWALHSVSRGGGSSLAGQALA